MTKRHFKVYCGLWVWLAFLTTQVQAEAVTMLGQNNFLQSRGQLIAIGNVSDNTRGTRIGSLFAGQQSGSLFAPMPVRISATALSLAARGMPVDRLRHLISQAESRLHGYDAVQHGARVRPQKPPTQMTLAEIYAWIDATPGQPHAIGRYQFVPPTLRQVAARAGALESDVFSTELQDRLADELLADAGFAGFQSGQIERHDFMNNLARIWAGLPNDTGLSHYDGYAGNKAAITWAEFDAAMIQIFNG